MATLITGVAGFIGMHAAKKLLENGSRVIGVDNLNDYYDPAFKQARLAVLNAAKEFCFEKLDFADEKAVLDLAKRYPEIDSVIHLGAQAGVRHSIKNPQDYVNSNLIGQLSIMEFCRTLMSRPLGCKNFIYASSSSVYGANQILPYSTKHRTDHPVSFYGATKKAAEVMAQSYAHLFRIPTIGLRFFTVYGPWGRPDMSPYIFTQRIIDGKVIEVFNNGNMKRDFTYIDDIVLGIIAAFNRPPNTGEAGAPHKIYNLGNNQPTTLMEYIRVIEDACGRPAKMVFKPLQPGDVLETFADLSDAKNDLDYNPSTPIAEGIINFVEWYKEYHKI